MVFQSSEHRIFLLFKKMSAINVLLNVDYDMLSLDSFYRIADGFLSVRERIESAYNVEILILECSFPDNLKRKGHLTPSECGKIAKATNCGRLILTHFYPEVLKMNIQTYISKFFPGPVDLAYDGMEVIIGD